MAYFSKRIREVLGAERANELEEIFRRIDSVNKMLEDAEERTKREMEADPTLAERIAKMHRTRPAKSARTLLKE
ncbi:hypothetical protein IMX07_00885 [bacterium]|nr:hypothetical protein [bacterium]